jgi:transcription elongation factor/antiterminator RfaH
LHILLLLLDADLNGLLMKHWYCIYTKPAQEDIICRKLCELPEIELLNPKLKRKKFARHRFTEVIEQLFPCYIFSKFDALQYFHLIRYTRGVKRFVGDRADSPYTVDDSIIEFIKAKMNDGLVTMEPIEFVPGQAVRIVDGPFGGLSGVFLEELKPHERVMILLNTIQYQAKVMIPLELVAAV